VCSFVLVCLYWSGASRDLGFLNLKKKPDPPGLGVRELDDVPDGGGDRRRERPRPRGSMKKGVAALTSESAHEGVRLTGANYLDVGRDFKDFLAAIIAIYQELVGGQKVTMKET